MNDAVLVGRFERLGDLTRNRNRLIERDRSLGQAIGERRPIDELEHEGLGSVRFLKAMDSSDIRMVEGREELGLALEPRDPVGIEREWLGQDLESDLTIELRVVGAIHLTHAAPANQGHDAVRSEARAWC